MIDRQLKIDNGYIGEKDSENIIRNIFITTRKSYMK